VQHWLLRAVDRTGSVLDILVQSRRDMHAAQRVLQKRQCRAPPQLRCNQSQTC
jgi:transposase-like protein